MAHIFTELTFFYSFSASIFTLLYSLKHYNMYDAKPKPSLVKLSIMVSLVYLLLDTHWVLMRDTSVIDVINIVDILWNLLEGTLFILLVLYQKNLLRCYYDWDRAEN